jgi:dolichol-phosphate mannosyltransferase
VFLGASLLTNWWSVLQLVAGCWVMLRIIRAARLAAPLDNETDLDVPIPTISVIIPARNEANRIRACLEAIVGAPGIYEVVVVDDESSDETAAVASRLGATVLSGKPIPNGWVGKAWALHQGVQAATGEWVVTLDADAVAHPQLAQAVVQRAQRDGLRFVSVGARFDCPSKGAQWLHPAMLTTLVYRYGPSGYKGKVKSDSQLANGQCMAFLRRDAIDHDVLTRVRGETIEDVALVRLVASMGWRVAMLDGSKLLTVRMFESFIDTWVGSFAFACKCRQRTKSIWAQHCADACSSGTVMDVGSGFKHAGQHCVAAYSYRNSVWNASSIFTAQSLVLALAPCRRTCTDCSLSRLDSPGVWSQSNMAW